MIFKTKILVLISISMLTLIAGLHCSKGKSPLKPENELPVDPRNFTWTVDTLRYPNSIYTYMFHIWGSSPENVYAVGDAGFRYGSLYHFNGNQWHTPRLEPGGGYSFGDVYGLSECDVWVVGGTEYRTAPDYTYMDSSLVMYFYGGKWHRCDTKGGRGLYSVWASSPDDVWAGGTNTLLHYDGTSWKHFPFELPRQGVHFTSIRGLAADDIYFIARRNDMVQPIDSLFYCLYHYDGATCSIIDSTCETVYNTEYKFGTCLEIVDGEVYSGNEGLFKLDGNAWTKLIDDRRIIRLRGSARNNIYCVGYDGTMYYYNGISWELITIDIFAGYNLFDVWTDGKEVFVLSKDGVQTYIFHGKIS